MAMTVAFDYHMYGAAMGTLSLQVSDNNGSTWNTIWSLTGQQQTSNAEAWRNASVDVNAAGYGNGVKVRFHYARGSSYTGDAALDNIEITSAGFSDTEGFETNLGDWADGGGTYTWTRQTGGTGSSGTGPSGAATGSYYIYCETSQGTTGSTYIIENGLIFDAPPVYTFVRHQDSFPLTQVFHRYQDLILHLIVDVPAQTISVATTAAGLKAIAEAVTAQNISVTPSASGETKRFGATSTDVAVASSASGQKAVSGAAALQSISVSASASGRKIVSGAAALQSVSTNVSVTGQKNSSDAAAVVTNTVSVSASGIRGSISSAVLQSVSVAATASGNKSTSGTATQPVTVSASASGQKSTSSTSSNYPDIVKADNPIAYWRLGESSGTTAFAEVGLDGTYVGTPTLGVASLLTNDTDTAVSLNATNDHINAGSPLLPLSGTAPFTIEVWTSKTVGQLQGGDSLVGQYDGSSSADANRFGVRIDQNGLVWYWHGSGSSCTGTTNIADGLPHHIVITRDVSSNVQIYVDNGAEGPLTADTAPFVNTETRIGQFGDLHSLGYIGVVDEPAIYDYALTPAQIENHYLNTSDSSSDSSITVSVSVTGSMGHANPVTAQSVSVSVSADGTTLRSDSTVLTVSVSSSATGLATRSDLIANEVSVASTAAGAMTRMFSEWTDYVEVSSVYEVVHPADPQTVDIAVSVSGTKNALDAAAVQSASITANASGAANRSSDLGPVDVAVAAVAVGQKELTGTASKIVVIESNVSGAKAIDDVVSMETVDISAAVSGFKEVSTTAELTVNSAVSAVGSKSIADSVTTTVSVTSEAAGTRNTIQSISTTITVEPIASGEKQTSGSATPTSVTVNVSATGARSATDAVSLDITTASTATGEAARVGITDTTIEVVSIASGQLDAVGSVSNDVTITASAVASDATRSGTAQDSVAVTTSATGIRSASGVTQRSVEVTSLATGFLGGVGVVNLTIEAYATGQGHKGTDGTAAPTSVVSASASGITSRSGTIQTTTAVETIIVGSIQFAVEILFENEVSAAASGAASRQDAIADDISVVAASEGSKSVESDVIADIVVLIDLQTVKHTAVQIFNTISVDSAISDYTQSRYGASQDTISVDVVVSTESSTQVDVAESISISTSVVGVKSTSSTCQNNVEVAETTTSVTARSGSAETVSTESAVSLTVYKSVYTTSLHDVVVSEEIESYKSISQDVDTTVVVFDTLESQVDKTDSISTDVAVELVDPQYEAYRDTTTEEQIQVEVLGSDYHTARYGSILERIELVNFASSVSSPTGFTLDVVTVSSTATYECNRVGDAADRVVTVGVVSQGDSARSSDADDTDTQVEPVAEGYSTRIASTEETVTVSASVSASGFASAHILEVINTETQADGFKSTQGSVVDEVVVEAILQASTSKSGDSQEVDNLVESLVYGYSNRVSSTSETISISASVSAFGSASAHILEVVSTQTQAEGFKGTTELSSSEIDVDLEIGTTHKSIYTDIYSDITITEPLDIFTTRSGYADETNVNVLVEAIAMETPGYVLLEIVGVSATAEGVSGRLSDPIVFTTTVADSLESIPDRTVSLTELVDIETIDGEFTTSRYGNVTDTIESTVSFVDGYMSVYADPLETLGLDVYLPAPSGYKTITLTLEDSILVRVIDLSGTALKAPVNVQLEEIDPGIIRITWDVVSGAQQGYDIMRDGEVIARDILGTEYVDIFAPDGLTEYRVGTVVRSGV